MKKKIIVGLLVISALSFSAAKNNQVNMKGNYQGNSHYTQMIDGLSVSQQSELNNLMKNRRMANYKKSLDIKTEELELEKLLLNDKINWQKVEKINTKISDMKSNQRLDNIKFRKSIEDKFGITMGHSSMNGHMRNQMMKGHRNHMDGKMMLENNRHMNRKMIDRD